MGFTSLNLLNDAIPIILAKVICDAESGIAKIWNGKNVFNVLIVWLEEKLNSINICVNSIAKAGTGLILDICEPTVLTIFWENKNAPNPIKRDEKKYNFLSFSTKFKFTISKLRDKKGE